VPEGKLGRPIPNLAKLSTPVLVSAMDSPNGWQRDTVQRLLFERGDKSADKQLQALLSVTHAPQVRLQALATLGMRAVITPELLLAVLSDPHPAVRCEALRQSESMANESDSAFLAVAALASDGDAAVRLQAAFSLGAWPPKQSEPVLRELGSRDDADNLLRIAIMSSLRPDSLLFEQLNQKTLIPNPAATVSLTPSSADRGQVIAGFSGVEKLVGHASRGRTHFQNLCTTCHRLGGEGHEVGPDLGMVATKPVDWLLTAILDPSQAVEARYRAWTITLKSAEELSGLISAETANNIVIRMAGGVDFAVLRTDIAAMQQSKLSLMPTGFESALKPQDMADLLSWLRVPASASDR